MRPLRALGGETIGADVRRRVARSGARGELRRDHRPRLTRRAHSPRWRGAAAAAATAEVSPHPHALPQPALAIGERAHLVIEARDAFGNPTLTGGDGAWSFKAGGADSRVVDRGDGSYDVEVWCTGAGSYSAAFSLVVSDDENAGGHAVVALPQRPLSLNVAPGPLAPDCVLRWPSTPAPSVVAGESCLITLVASDPWGNAPASLGGAQGTLELLRGHADLSAAPDFCPCELQARPVSASASEILIRASPTRVGAYVPVLTVGGRAFRPPREDYVVVVRHAPPSAERSDARGAGLQGGSLRDVAQLSVVVHDAYGNALLAARPPSR